MVMQLVESNVKPTNKQKNPYLLRYMYRCLPHGHEIIFICPADLFQKFTDGITNTLVGLYHKDTPTDILLMRIYGHNTHLLIDREAEKSNFRVSYYLL